MHSLVSAASDIDSMRRRAPRPRPKAAPPVDPGALASGLHADDRITAIPFFHNASACAGFGSPAEDFDVRRLDINDLILRHPNASFWVRVAGDSMVDAGIHDGDLALVDRALEVVHGSIVFLQVDGEFTIKQYFRRNGRDRYVPANPTYPELVPKPGQHIERIGVIAASVTLCAQQGRALASAGKR